MKCCTVGAMRHLCTPRCIISFALARVVRPGLCVNNIGLGCWSYMRIFPGWAWQGPTHVVYLHRVLPSVTRPAVRVYPWPVTCITTYSF